MHVIIGYFLWIIIEILIKFLLNGINKKTKVVSESNKTTVKGYRGILFWVEFENMLKKAFWGHLRLLNFMFKEYKKDNLYMAISVYLCMKKSIFIGYKEKLWVELHYWGLGGMLFGE